MASYNEILNTLRQDMNDHIDPTNGYNYKPTIRHGVFASTQLEGKLPAVCFECYKEDFSESISNNIMAEMTIKVYGFIKNSGTNTDAVRSLAHDVVYFLYSSDNSQTNDTWIDNEIEYWESGAIKQTISSFVFDIRIKNDLLYTTLRD